METQGTPFVGTAYHIKTVEFADCIDMSEFVVRSDVLQRGRRDEGSSLWDGRGEFLLLQKLAALRREEKSARAACLRGVQRAVLKYKEHTNALLDHAERVKLGLGGGR